MKYKLLVVAIFVLFINTLKAQNEQIFSTTLNWTGVEKWFADSSSINVVSFQGAQYPGSDRIPYFNKRISCDPAFSYSAEIKNPVYVSLTPEENEIISGSNSIPEIISLNTNILRSKNISYFDVLVLPFVKNEGKILKLQSFDLVITKSSRPQKVSASTIHTYADNSVLAQGKFVKIKITNSGVYKLTYEDLNSMGINPANVRIFGYGGGMLEQSFLLPKIDDLQEIAIDMEKGSDGIFNAGDYILFYAQGINRWAYDKTKSMFTHVLNLYSNYGYYFVTSDAGTGKKIENKDIVLPDNITINQVNEFTDYQVYEKELFSIISSGKDFYGESFRDVTSYNFPFTFPNPVTTNSTYARLDVAASSTVASSFSLSLNSSQTKTLNIAQISASDSYEIAKAGNAIFTFTPQSDQFTFNISYNKSTATSVGYLNYLELNVRRKLIMSGSAMQFQNVDYLGTGTYNQYMLSGAGSNVKIWDITDKQNISSIPTQNIDGQISFTDSGNDVKNYLAIDPTASSAFPKPTIVGVVANQNLHGLSPANLTIITHPDFLSQAETLAQAHRDIDNLSVNVVTTDQVYNEFSSGAPDATSYRWLMKMFYDRAIAANDSVNMPKYLLLFGRGSFDNRGVILNSGDNKILTYQAENSLITTLSYVTDDYFGLLDDNEGTQVPANLLDIGIGRFPVSTSQQATNVVNKTIGYMKNTGKGAWKNQLCYLADDGDAALHMRQADSVASSVGRLYPAYQINKIYLDAYQQEISASGESYPLAKSHFQNLLRSGLLLLDYTGHAGATGWGNESILSINDVKNLSNSHLPLFVGATCDFLQFDVQIVSAGEQVVLNPSGGGIGILSAARPVYASQNMTLNKLFCENLFKKVKGQNLRIGDVLPYAKNKVGTEINKLSYIYMGDPAVKLDFPSKYNVVTTKINDSVLVADTLRALSVASVQGIIADDNGNRINDFNGTVHVVVYDKVQRITTLNNEHDGALTYSDRPNVLFSGDAEVKSGAFTFSFMLPKDIKYNFGSGRINYYAEDDVNDYEAQGYYENFIVGGTNPDFVNETDGPDVQLYLNSNNFISGDKVNETPLFIANVSDISGINTVGSGIGHDITLTVDQDPTLSYVINDYFQAATNSYTDGSVKYKLPEMENGKHTLTFRVWDLLNNSTTKTIDFEVVKGLTPVIFSVYNYPNPVKTETYIKVDHDRPETILRTTVEIFDLAGRKIWSFSQASADNIKWDLTGSNGEKVKTGIYLYRVNIKTSDSDVSSKTNKMLVVEQ